MRVLFVAQADPRGSVHRLARILRAEELADARVVLLSEPRRGELPCDLARLHDGGQELEALLDDAEALHLVDLVPSQVPVVRDAMQKRRFAPRWVLQWNRAPFRSELREMGAMRDKHDVRTLQTRPGLLEDADAFQPEVVPTWRSPWLPVLPGTNARTRRATATIFASAPRSVHDEPRLEALIESAESVSARCSHRRVEVLASRPHLQVLQRQRRAQMMLATADHGLPMIALEGLAQGLRVVVDSPTNEWNPYAALAGGTPAPVLTPAEMPSAIVDLDPKAEPDEAAVAWARCVLDPRRVVGACLRLYGLTPCVRAA